MNSETEDARLAAPRALPNRSRSWVPGTSPGMTMKDAEGCPPTPPFCDSRCTFRYCAIHTVCHTLYGTQVEVGGDGDHYESYRLELRRGSLMLGVLARLREERYGYTLRQALAADGLEMEESTLYPLLRRLETQGLLIS